MSEETLGMRLRAARIIAGATQQQVAEAVGLHRQTIGRYERDLVVSDTGILVVLARYFGQEFGWLATGTRELSWREVAQAYADTEPWP